MCLEVLALLPRGEKQKVKAVDVAAASGLHAAAARTDDGRVGFQFSASGGCSCDLMADRTEEDSAAWKLRPNQLEPLEKAVAFIAKRSRSFSFRAEWLGLDGRSARHATVSLNELADDIRNNKLQNGLEYVIAG
jgi:hypothetical protein